MASATDTPSDASAPLPKEYVGGCHCKRFRYTFPHVPFEDGQFELHYCNCSYCDTKGLIYAYAPVRVAVTAEYPLIEMPALYQKSSLNSRAGGSTT